MRIEEMYTGGNFKMIHLDVEPDHVGDVLNWLLCDGKYMYIYDDILVKPDYYSSYYGRPNRTIQFLVKEKDVDEMLSLCIGQEFIMKAWTLIPA